MSDPGRYDLTPPAGIHHVNRHNLPLEFSPYVIYVYAKILDHTYPIQKTHMPHAVTLLYDNVGLHCDVHVFARDHVRL